MLRGEVYDERVKVGPRLGLKDPRDSVWIERVGGEAIHRLGGHPNALTRLERLYSAGERGGARLSLK
jgi:hypothetical protein